MGCAVNDLRRISTWRRLGADLVPTRCRSDASSVPASRSATATRRKVTVTQCAETSIRLRQVVAVREAQPVDEVDIVRVECVSRKALRRARPPSKAPTWIEVFQRYPRVRHPVPAPAGFPEQEAAEGRTAEISPATLVRGRAVTPPVYVVRRGRSPCLPTSRCQRRTPTSGDRAPGGLPLKVLSSLMGLSPTGSAQIVPGFLERSTSTHATDPRFRNRKSVFAHPSKWKATPGNQALQFPLPSRRPPTTGQIRHRPQSLAYLNRRSLNLRERLAASDPGACLLIGRNLVAATPWRTLPGRKSPASGIVAQRPSTPEHFPSSRRCQIPLHPARGLVGDGHPATGVQQRA